MNFDIKELEKEDLVILKNNWGVIEPFEKRLNSMKKGQSSFYIVWSEDKKPIGHGRIWWKETPIIEDMSVDENLRSNGIGSDLLNHLEFKIKEKGYFNVKLFVELENQKAEKLYLKKGYVFTGKIEKEEKELIKKL